MSGEPVAANTNQRRVADRSHGASTPDAVLLIVVSRLRF
jgi:hypothetical protein